MSHDTPRSRERQRLELEEALRDQTERVARDDSDWSLYFPGDPRPHIPWWRRVLKI